MKKTILAAFMALGLFSCAPKNSAVVDITVDGAASKDLIVSRLAVNQIRIVDTIKTNNNGKASFTVEQPDASPNFYYLSYNRKKLASLILAPGDKISLSVDTLGSNLKIAGSKESELLYDIESKLLSTIAKFDSLSVELVNARDIKDEDKVLSIRKELGKLYVKQKQYAVKSIICNPYSMTNVNLLYQQLSESLPIFAQANDILYTRRVYDSLSTLFPNSVYVKSLRTDIEAYDKIEILNSRINEASKVNFPEISLPNVKAEKVSLSSLDGKPFILLFWSAQDLQQKLFNNDLAELYKKYNKKGLEIYQVCVDADKTAWATAVKEQGLEWINVCDGLANASPAVASYNIQKVPSLFIFNKKGDIVARDVYDKSALDKEIAKIVK